MSISIKQGSWSFDVKFSSISDFSQAIKLAQTTLNTHLTNSIQTNEPVKEKKKIVEEDNQEEEDDQNWEEIDNIYQ